MNILRFFFPKKDRGPSPELLKPKGEPQEVWQWQINTVGKEFDRGMPKNFGLLIGTFADAEARLKESISLQNYYKTIQNTNYGITSYKFYETFGEEIHIDYGKHFVQSGAKR